FFPLNLRVLPQRNTAHPHAPQMEIANQSPNEDPMRILVRYREIDRYELHKLYSRHSSLNYQKQFLHGDDKSIREVIPLPYNLLNLLSQPLSFCASLIYFVPNNCLVTEYFRETFYVIASIPFIHFAIATKFS